ncbi:PIN domain-containing protein [Corallococcus sp. bb12-1]|uniref:PIN domain-containing protein n=1 Tax=Corallococcus sp. bb12-1 TaxID=2996784 RepID=UPI00226E7ADE|nr:PIN domain-containing protein [Corallococcus sp. bb12-1]MCY1043328.1 PIN domain-containing protein [Corallococcus sp. bb12-1]
MSKERLMTPPIEDEAKTKDVESTVGAVPQLPIPVIIDSSAFRYEVSARSTALKRLEELVQKGVAQVLVPIVVQRELSTGISFDVKKFEQKAWREPLKAISWCHPQADIEDMENAHAMAASVASRVDKAAEEGVAARLAALNARILPVTAMAAEKAFDFYFTGSGPVQHLKNRDDLPDAFIAAIALEEQARLGRKCHAIVGDKALRVFLAKCRFEVHENIGAFNTSTVVLSAYGELKRGDAPQEGEFAYVDDQYREGTEKLVSIIRARRQEVEGGVKAMLFNFVDGMSLSVGFLPSEGDVDVVGGGSVVKIDFNFNHLMRFVKEEILLPTKILVRGVLVRFMSTMAGYSSWRGGGKDLFRVISSAPDGGAVWIEGSVDLQVSLLSRVNFSFADASEPVISSSVVDVFEDIVAVEAGSDGAAGGLR